MLYGMEEKVKNITYRNSKTAEMTEAVHTHTHTHG